MKYIGILVLLKNQTEFYDSNRTCDAGVPKYVDWTKFLNNQRTG